MKALLGFLVDRGLVVNLISLFLVVLGLYAMIEINREAFPNVNLDRIQVDTIYPGTTPEEIERLIITPIEQELRSVNGIDKMLSVAFPESGRITLELNPDAGNRVRMVSDVQQAVDRARLPQDLPNDPSVLEIDGAVFPVIQLAVSADLSPLEVKRLGDRIKDDLLGLVGVARIIIKGSRKAEIRVVVDPGKLGQQRISIDEVAQLLSNWNVNAPGGDIDTPSGQQAVRIVGEFSNAEDAANLYLRANERGGGIRLGDVATVSESLEEPRTIHDVEGKPALAMIVLKKSDADIITTVDAVLSYLETVPKRYGNQVKVTTFQDFSRFARLRLSVLTNNAKVGLFLVFISLILFLRPSVALTTTWGLPIVFLTGLFVLHQFGITLNLISMMGFILVLGMLVDDAIIVGENITYHMEQGMTPHAAAVKGSMELLGPVIATVLTTVAAFLPMLFMSGIIGKFIVAIPTVVILLLLLSLLESFLILPSHVAHVTNAKKKPPEKAWLLALEERYGRLLEQVLKHRYITVGLSLLILLASLVLAKTAMSFQLFPPVGVDQFLVRVTAPPGTNLVTMREHLRAIDKDIRAAVAPEYLETTLLGSGEIAIDQGDPLTQRGGRFGQISTIYIPAVLRPEHNALEDMHALARSLPEKYPDLEIAFTELKPGPPTGRPLEVEISSTDNAASASAAARLLAMLKDVSGVTSVDSGLQPGDDELRIVLDRSLAAYAGIDLATVARHVRAAAGGLVVDTSRRGTEEIDITIRFPDGAIDDIGQLENLLIPNKRGGLIPLSKVASFEKHPGFTTIRHKSGIRIINVVADINTEIITSNELNKLVAGRETEWLGEDADRIQVNYGGEEEKNRESFRDLGVAFGFALIAIFFILAIQFNNMSYPFVVMMAIPFGAIGIILSFYLHDLFWKPMPLSFFSTMGMVALTGVVVNSSLILLVFIQRAMKEGMTCRDAIVQAGRRRLRAVLLTAMTTVVGLLPTAYGWGGLDQFVSPMALALSWGLVFATLITLVAIPAMLAVGVDMSAKVRESVHRIRNRRQGNEQVVERF